MKTAGYVIAKNKGLKEFFTSKSAYDRPRWVSLAEATTYPTAELAERASTKLYKSSGAYEARMVSVEDLHEAPISAIAQDRDPLADDLTDDSKMTAKNQTSEDPTVNTEEPLPSDAASGDGELEDIVDRQLGDDDMVDVENMPSDTDLSPELEDDDLEADHLTDKVTESTTIPKKMSDDALPSENKTTANTMKSTPIIKYTDPSTVSDKPDTDLTADVGAPDDKIKVPDSIKDELTDAIAEFEKAAKFSNTRDDTKASFCLTVADAFRELLDHLNKGTVEGMKLAQLHMLSLMNPISTHLPVNVQKFVTMGGRKPTLKDIFNNKREDKKSV